MDLKFPSMVVVGLLAAYAGYYTYTQAGLLSGMMAVIASAWLLYRFSSADRAWKTFKWMKSPPVMAMIAFLAAFVYTSSKGTGFNQSLIISVGAALLGVTAGMFLFKYWNIGEP